MPHRKQGELTLKERKFVKNYINGDTKKLAALKAYDTSSDHNASQLAKQILKRPIVQEYIKQILERKGLSLEDLGDKLHSAIDNNLKNGKASQAVGADLLKFSFKLQDAIPSTKTVSTKFSLQADVAPHNVDDLTKQLEKIAESATTLLKELKK